MATRRAEIVAKIDVIMPNLTNDLALPVVTEVDERVVPPLAFPPPGERRRAEQALAWLRPQIATLSGGDFHEAVVRSLADVADRECAFIAALVDSRAPSVQLQALHRRPVDPGVDSGGVPALAPAAAWTEKDVQALGAERALDRWLLATGWLQPLAPLLPLTHPLLACDGSLIGFIGIASMRRPPAADRHLRSCLKSYAVMVARVLERANAVANLERDRSQLTAIISSVMDAIVSVDESNIVVRFNPAAEKMFGYSAGKVVGRHVSMLMPPDLHKRQDARVQDVSIFGVSLSCSGTQGTIPCLRADGHEFQAEISISRVESANGTEFTVIMRDVSARRRLEQESRDRAQELSRTGGLLTLGEMASTFAHELNQPLTSIANFSAGSLARIDAGTAGLQDLKGILQVVSEEADRASKILKGIRRLMERREFVALPVLPNEIALEAIELSGISVERPRIRLDLQFAEDLKCVLADRVLLQIVLVNLLRNAVEAIESAGPESGTLTIRTMNAGASYVEICVADNGCGLPQADAGAVFEAFFTTKKSCLGLGLAISRSIVESHGGRIWATRNGNGGSTFHFTVPVITRGVQ